MSGPSCPRSRAWLPLHAQARLDGVFSTTCSPQLCFLQRPDLKEQVCADRLCGGPAVQVGRKEERWCVPAYALWPVVCCVSGPLWVGLLFTENSLGVRDWGRTYRVSPCSTNSPQVNHQRILESTRHPKTSLSRNLAPI